MPKHTNFLLGYGERLVEPVEHRSGPRDTSPPYDAEMARTRLSGFVSTTARELNALPDIVCPSDRAVAVLTLHPQYIAKSHYPNSLLIAAGFEPIGSKPTVITPEKLSRERKPKPAPTTDLFVAVPRSQIARLAQMLPTWQPTTQAAQNDFTKVENLRAMTIADRLKKIASRGKQLPLEIVVHAGPDRASAYILEGLEAYLAELDVKPRFDKKFHVGGLCFLPVEAARDAIPRIAEFSFVRVVRELPRLRTISPSNTPLRQATSIVLPTDGPQNPDLRLAVFDGGLAPQSPLTNWATAHNPPGVGVASEDHLIHGHHVTSALLFGSLREGKTPERPYAHVDHYRVLDVDSENDPFELYDVLDRIKSVLETRRYEFINLSVGPALPIEDDDVHGWTSYFDQFLSTGTTLAAIAVGNTGELDWDTGNARIQVPADCVNALAVGSASSIGKKWARSSYSSIGPGRRPGAMKPDVLAFGGSDEEPFIVLDPSNGARCIAVVGTSFATPNSLRVASGIRTHLGNTIWPLSIRALLVHCAECPGDNHIEHGWGRIPHDVEDVLLCPDDTVRVLYQGELSPAEYRRARIPVPAQPMAGMVSIKATFCYTCPVDPQDPGNYTRSGLDIVFRPNEDDLDEDALHPASDSFFQLRKFSTERELRHDALKWETTLHREKSKRGSSLNNPVFDIHYNARAEGRGAGADAKPMRYALVVTVQSKRTADLYNQIVRRYRAQLEPLRPVVQIPLRAA